MKLLGLLLFFTFIQDSLAKSFSNQYTEFELPPNWECVLEGSEYVCQGRNSDRKKEAIIILAAKIRGPQDTLDGYQAYLKKAKTYQLPGGKTQVSEAKYAKTKSINNHTWIDSLHLASEVPGFYTRYLATVKEDLGVAITFSVIKSKYTQYQPVFEKIVSSIKVFRQKKSGLSKIRLAKDEAGSSGIENTTFVPDANIDIAANSRQTKKREDSGEGDSSLLYLLLAGVVGFIILKKKKKA